MNQKLRRTISVVFIIVLIVGGYFAGRYHEAYRAGQWRAGRVATLLHARDNNPERLSAELDREAYAELNQANLLSS
jgi:hypothetical protein